MKNDLNFIYDKVNFIDINDLYQQLSDSENHIEFTFAEAISGTFQTKDNTSVSGHIVDQYKHEPEYCEGSFSDGDFDSDKHVFRRSYYNWLKGIVSPKFFISYVKLFIDKQSNGSWDEFLEFHNWNYIDHPESIIEIFEFVEFSEGIGDQIGVDNITFDTMDQSDGAEELIFDFYKKYLIKEGENLIYYKSGLIKYKAYFKNNQLDGELKEYFEDGKIKEIELYKDGVKIECKHYNKDEKLTLKEIFNNGVLSSSNSFEYFDNGKIKTESLDFVYSKEHANQIIKSYNEKGVLIAQANFKGGNQTGIIKVYDEYGDIESEQSYKDGIKDGITKFYDDGIITEEVEFRNDLRNGLTKIYHSNGQLRAKVYYLDGNQADGVVDSYDENGNLFKRANIKDGKFHGKQTSFHSNGEIKVEITYDNGIKMGEFKEFDTEANLLKEHVHTKSNQSNLKISNSTQFEKKKLLVNANSMIFFNDLDLETTLEDVCVVFDISLQELIHSLNTDRSYDEVEDLDILIDEDLNKVVADIWDGCAFDFFELINSLQAAQDEPFEMIVKDEYYGQNEDGEKVAYIGFECVSGLKDPPPLKGGEYDEKFLMSDEEIDEFNNLLEQELIYYDVKYQEKYFILSSKYDSKKWTEDWLVSDKNYWNNKE